jgi:hypothetical protein
MPVFPCVTTTFSVFILSQNGENKKIAQKRITTVFYDTLRTPYICPNPCGYRTFSLIFLLPQNGEQSFSTKCAYNFHCFKIVSNIKYMRIDTYFCIMLVNAIIGYCAKSLLSTIYLKSNTVINL